MRNKVKTFENERLNLQVRTITNEDGSISVSAEDTAIGFGWYKTEIKNGKKYISIRWERVNSFSAECGFDHSWAKDDYIPESLFYMLSMKANNEKAVKFQKWIAFEVLPSLRKTGTYTMNTTYQYPVTPATATAAAELGRVILKIMKMQGSAPHEIAAVFKMECEQLGIELPSNFVKFPAYEQLSFPKIITKKQYYNKEETTSISQNM